MTTVLLIDAHMQLAHPTWILGTPPASLTLAYTDKCYCPAYTLVTELTKTGATNNNLHFLSVDFPHIQTVETTVNPDPFHMGVSDEWKTLNNGEGTLPIHSFASLHLGKPNDIHRKVKHPLTDRTRVIDTTPFPPPDLQHLWV
jgi:hypothetical protein